MLPGAAAPLDPRFDRATPRFSARPLRRKLGHTFVGRDESLGIALSSTISTARFPAAEQDASAATRRIGAAYANYMAYWNPRRRSARLLPRMLYADQKTYLVELLMKQDQMSMACSIESRVPFLDHTFVEFAMRMPDR